MNKGILMILDGYGEGREYKFNAVTNAKTPTLDKLKKQSCSLLKTSGESVGLFDGNMGGSEVGHMTIGAGRLVPSTNKLIHDEIKCGNFEKNKAVVKMLDYIKKRNSCLHLIGLMSDKNIHSNINHLYEILRISHDKANKIYIHFITDGRDCGKHDSIKYLKELKNVIKKYQNIEILSISGRFYAMDRENYQERTEKAFEAMFGVSGGIKVGEEESYILSQHNLGNNDQMIQPTHVLVKSFIGVQKEDVLCFFNFREDRLRQMVKKVECLKVKVFTMSNVANTKATPFYPSKIVKHTLSEYLSDSGLNQIKISETTKYAHVTYFLNGGVETPFKNEDRIHVPTIKTKDYSLTPRMQAGKITKAIKNAIKSKKDAIIVNYSNPDMLGHTGNYEATVKAIEYLDKCVTKVLKWARKNEYFVLITADHGNSEEMQLANGEPQLAHTLNDVFCVVANSGLKMRKHGELKDVAPTFVELLGLKPYKYFKGSSLIER